MKKLSGDLESIESKAGFRGIDRLFRKNSPIFYELSRDLWAVFFSQSTQSNEGTVDEALHLVVEFLFFLTWRSLGSHLSRRC